jgi:excisionase family DNA binding protein
MDELLTVSEVADLLKVNQQTVRNWIDAGKLPAVRVGSRRVRVARPALDAFVLRGATDSTSALADGVAALDPARRAEIAEALEKVSVAVSELAAVIGAHDAPQAPRRGRRAGPKRTRRDS